MNRTDTARTARTDIARPDQEPGLRASTRDTTRIDDTRIEAVRPLITPALLMEKWPGSEATLALVERSREAIARVLKGQDDRLVVVVGPVPSTTMTRRWITRRA
jgi:3-deoxy-7-phosphoheptulonate synthase